MGTCGHFLPRVLAPFLTLSLTLSRLWGRSKEPSGPGGVGAEEFMGQAPAGLPGWDREGVCVVSRVTVLPMLLARSTLASEAPSLPRFAWPCWFSSSARPRLRVGAAGAT